MIDHRTAESLMAAAIDFPLSPDEQTALEAHLAGCDQCRTVGAQLRRHSLMLGEMATEGAPMRIRSAVEAAALQAGATNQRLMLLLAAALLAAAAIGGAAVVGSGVFDLDDLSINPALPSPSVAASDAPGLSPVPTPSPADDQHLAAGLALVRFPDEGSPASQVFVVDPDGELRQVTGLGSEPSLGASFPTWSPNGDQLVFNPPKVGAGPRPQFGVVNADGTGERFIAEGWRPRWSPEGTRILFQDPPLGTASPGAAPAMWVADLATGDVTRIGFGIDPAWLPDGRQVSFLLFREGRVAGDPLAITEVVYVMSLDGGEPQEFATASGAYWSPDGTAVLLHQTEAPCTRPFGCLFLAAADGSGARELVTSRTGSNPAWSPDGSRIALLYDIDPTSGVPIMGVVDRNGRLLWSGVTGQSWTWSPDGTRLAVEDPVDQAVRVLDASTGRVLWETAGSQPAWAH